MSQNNSLNNYSSVFNIGDDVGSASTPAQPLTVRKDANADTRIDLNNLTSGTAASAYYTACAASGCAVMGHFDSSYTTTASFAGKTVISDNDAGIVLNMADSSSDLKFTRGGIVFWEMSGTLERTMVAQPCFSAYNSVTDTNVTGDGTLATVDFDTVVIDQNTDFASDTFTAPVAGRYFLSASVTLSGVTASETGSRIDIVTSNRDYNIGYGNVGALQQSGLWQLTSNVIADMDSSDTAVIKVLISGGTKVVDVFGTSAPGTWFMGYLLC